MNRTLRYAKKIKRWKERARYRDYSWMSDLSIPEHSCGEKLTDFQMQPKYTNEGFYTDTYLTHATGLNKII